MVVFATVHPAVIGAACFVLVVLFLVVCARSARRPPVSVLESAEALDISALPPIRRDAHVEDADEIRAIARLMRNGRRRDHREILPAVILTFYAQGMPRHVEASAFGWNYAGEALNCRELVHPLAFLERVEALLPSVTEADLDRLPMPEEDLSWFDESKVPEDLRDLVPLALKWGVGDDLVRGELLRRATEEERAELRTVVGPRAERIREYIESLGPLSLDNPLSDEATRMMYLEIAAWQDAAPPGND